MRTENDLRDIGSQLGEDGVKSVVAKVEQYCAHEEKRITLENHAPVVTLKAECSLLLEEEQRLREVLQSAPPPGDLLHHRGRRIFAGVVAAVLTITGFFLAVLTFAPFRLGWQGYLFCCGVATVVPFLVEKLLAGWRSPWIVNTLTALAAVAGIVSLMLLADVRGHYLAHQVESPPALVIDGADTQDEPPKDDFYHATLDSLRFATILLSFAMELGAGLALREACTAPPHDLGHWTQLRRNLAEIQAKLVVRAGQITRLEDEPSIFTAGFWRDFYKSMLTHTVRSAMKKLLMVALGAALVVPAARAADTKHLDLVIALDLSRSVAAKGPDGKTEFEKNVDGVGSVLAQVPVGAHVTVIGITDRSFAQPYILMSAMVPDDPGYFGERLRSAHAELAHAWLRRSAKFSPVFTSTDIVGAFGLAGQIFAEQTGGSANHVLVVFSDMQNHTAQLDLETPKGLVRATKFPFNSRLVYSSLNGVQVFALGVEGSRSESGTWETRKTLWRRYLEGNGAKLKTYSPLRNFSGIIADKTFGRYDR